MNEHAETSVPEKEKKTLRVGFYDIEKTIGKGNFAVVKLAQHRITKSKVAIKIIDKSHLDDAGLKKVYREISILKQLHHPNIVSLYQVMESPKILYIVTEYAPNGEVYNYITKNGRFTEEHACKLFGQLVKAMRLCHDNHVVHRDLKAENLLIDHDMNLKLADFGFGSFYQEDQQLSTWCGSPPYAAPEMFLGKPYDPQAVDVWSLGVILYVLVCGTLPFDAPTLPALKKRVLSCRFRIPFSMSTDCESLIRRMLVREPSKRLRLSEIEDQKWMQLLKGDATPQNDLATNRQRYHDQTIRLMRSLGINTAKALESVRLDSYDHYMAIYLLLCERCKQQSSMTVKPQAKAAEPRSQATPILSQAGSEAATMETAKDVNSQSAKSPCCVNPISEECEREDCPNRIDTSTSEQSQMQDQSLNRPPITTLFPQPAQSPTTRSLADSLMRYSIDEGIIIDESDRVSRNMQLSNSDASCMSTSTSSTDKREDSLIQQSAIASSQMSTVDTSECSQDTNSVRRSSISPTCDTALSLERQLAAINTNLDSSDSDERTATEGSDRANTPKFLLSSCDSPALSTIGVDQAPCNQVPCAAVLESSDLLFTDNPNSDASRSEADERTTATDLSNEDAHNSCQSQATNSNTVQRQNSLPPLQISFQDSFTSDTATDESDIVYQSSPRMESKLNNASQAPPRRQRMSVPLLPSKRIVSQMSSNAEASAYETGSLTPAQSLPNQPTTAVINVEQRSIKPLPFTSPLRVDELSRQVPRFVAQNEQNLVPFLRTQGGGALLPRICTPLRR